MSDGDGGKIVQRWLRLCPACVHPLSHPAVATRRVASFQPRGSYKLSERFYHLAEALRPRQSRCCERNKSVFRWLFRLLSVTYSHEHNARPATNKKCLLDETSCRGPFPPCPLCCTWKHRWTSFTWLFESLDSSGETVSRGTICSLRTGSD